MHKAEVLGMANDVEVCLMYMPAQARGLTFAEWRKHGFPPLHARCLGRKEKYDRNRTDDRSDQIKPGAGN